MRYLLQALLPSPSSTIISLVPQCSKARPESTAHCGAKAVQVVSYNKDLAVHNRKRSFVWVNANIVFLGALKKLDQHLIVAGKAPIFLGKEPVSWTTYPWLTYFLETRVPAIWWRWETL